MTNTEKDVSDFEGKSSLVDQLDAAIRESTITLSEERKAELKQYVDRLVAEQDASAIDGRLEDVSRQLAELSPILNDTYLVEKAAEYQLPLQKVEEVPFLQTYVAEKQQERIKDPAEKLLSLAEPLEKAVEQIYSLVRDNHQEFELVTDCYFWEDSSPQLPSLTIKQKSRRAESQYVNYRFQDGALVVKLQFQDKNNEFESSLAVYFQPERKRFFTRKKVLIFAATRREYLFELGDTLGYLRYLISVADLRPSRIFQVTDYSPDSGNATKILNRRAQDLPGNIEFITHLLKAPKILPPEIQSLKLKKQQSRQKLWSQLTLPEEEKDNGPR